MLPERVADHGGHDGAHAAKTKWDRVSMTLLLWRSLMSIPSNLDDVEALNRHDRLIERWR
jgi:hypothetical protein